LPIYLELEYRFKLVEVMITLTPINRGDAYGLKKERKFYNFQLKSIKIVFKQISFFSYIYRITFNSSNKFTLTILESQFAPL
jgi:hypothetical protein